MLSWKSAFCFIKWLPIGLFWAQLYLQASKNDIKNGNSDEASNSEENQDDNDIDEADVVIESEEPFH